MLHIRFWALARQIQICSFLAYSRENTQSILLVQWAKLNPMTLLLATLTYIVIRRGKFLTLNHLVSRESLSNT